MSNSSSTVPREPSSRFREVIDAPSLRQGAALVATPLRFVAFWAAVALPFLYLPLLYGGLTGEQTAVFAGLLGANLLALFLGHGYGR